MVRPTPLGCHVKCSSRARLTPAGVGNGGKCGANGASLRGAFARPSVASFGMIPCRQCGHVSCSFSQAPIQSPWNQCRQGKMVTSSPISTLSMHTEHSAFPSLPIMLLSISCFGSPLMASAEAGPGADDPLACSINCEITRSRASSVYTASPLAALAGLRS